MKKNKPGHIRFRLMRLFIISCFSLISLTTTGLTEEGEVLQLGQASMCETVRDGEPFNQAVVFSVKLGSISCFTSFDPVPEMTVIYHKWFKKDKLSKKNQLSLKQPRWSTYSTMQLRDGDKGPWRVEISDEKGKVFKVLRFSIVD